MFLLKSYGVYTTTIDLNECVSISKIINPTSTTTHNRFSVSYVLSFVESGEGTYIEHFNTEEEAEIRFKEALAEKEKEQNKIYKLIKLLKLV